MAAVTTVANPLAGVAPDIADAAAERAAAMARRAPAASGGPLEPGNIDLHKRPVVKNADGSISTVRSMSFGEDGKEVLVPTVAADGSRILNDQEAIDQYHRTGQHLGKFATPEAATAYAQQLHQQQAREYLPPATNDSLGPAYQAHVQSRQVMSEADAERAAARASRAAAAAPGSATTNPTNATNATKPAEPPAPGTPEATAAAAAEEPGFLHRLGTNLAHPIAAMEASVPLGASALAAGGKDVLAGATLGAIPAALGGARDATQHTLELIKSTGDWLDANVAHLPLPQSLQGAAEMPAELPGKGTLTGTATEGVLRTGMDYLSGFALGGKVFDALKVGEIAGPAMMNVGKGVIADFVAMDPKGERLTNLWGKLGLPANVVTDWLAAKPGDSEAEGRFKNALEGAGLGALAGGIGQAADAWKAAREAAAAKPGAVVDAATAGAPKVSLEELKAKLGDPESQSFVRRNQPAAAAEAPAPTLTAADVAGQRAEGLASDIQARTRPVEIHNAIDPTGDLRSFFLMPDGRLRETLEGHEAFYGEGQGIEALAGTRVAAVRTYGKPGGAPQVGVSAADALTDAQKRALGNFRRTLGSDAVNVSDPAAGPLAPAEEAALRDYKDMGYLNQRLFSEGKLDPPAATKAGQQAATLDAALAKSRVEQDTTVYRGIFTGAKSGDPETMVGKELPASNFQSTTTDRGAALEYAGAKGDGGVLLEMNVPAGSRGARLDQYAKEGRPAENELLLPRDGSFKVTAARKEGNVTVLTGDWRDATAAAPHAGNVGAGEATILRAQDVGAGVVPRRPGQTLGQQAAAKVGASVAATADVPLEAGAKGLAFAEHTPSFYVNWSKVDAPEDVQRAMSQMADAFTGDLEAARRGEVSFEQQKLGAQAENAWNVLVTRRQGQPLNAEQSLAARELWASSGAKLSELAQAAADSPSDANLFAFQKQLATHHMVQTQVVAARTETARALGSWKIPVGGDEERARQIDWLLANQGGQETTKALAQRMAILARGGNVAGLDMMAEKAGTLTTMDAIRSAWVNALLSSPATHLANTGDNLVMAAQQVWERYGAEKISAALGQQDGVAHGEALAMTYGMVSSWKDALRYAAKASVTGESGFGIGKVEEARPFAMGRRATGLGGDYATNGGELGRAVDYLAQVIRSPKVALGEVLNSPGTALVAEDEFFKTIGYRAEVHAQSLRQATQEARSGAIASDPEAIGRRMAELVRDPPENVRMAAVDQALYQTLNNAPGELGKQIIKLRDAMTVKGVPIGNVLMPFAKVPANSMSYLLARTPLAPLMNTFSADIAAGGPRQSLALSRLAFGSLTMMATADLAMGGLITGSGPKDAVGRAALPRDWQPYSVKGVDGRYYSFNRLGAIGSQLGIAADLVDYFHNTDYTRRGGSEPVMPVWAAALLMTANNALSKSFVQGMAQVNDALADPQRYGPKFFEGLAGSVVPGIVATTAREMDPHAKDVRGMLDAIMARTPGLSDKVPNRLDLWGRPITYQSGLGGAYDMLSPVRATSGKTDEPIDKEIAKQGIAPTLPQRVVSFAAGAPPTDLERFPGAYQRYQALAGNDAKLPQWGGMGAKDYLNSVVSGRHPMSQVYRMGTDGPDGGKATFIKDVISKARAAALVTLRTERPDVRVAVSKQMTTPRIQGVPAMPAVPMLNQ